MANPAAILPLPKPVTRIDINTHLNLLSGGTDIAVRSAERWWQTQLDGCRDWMNSVSQCKQTPFGSVEQHLDHSLHLGCDLFVAQVAAMTESMQLVEKAIAESHKAFLSQLHEGSAAVPVRSAVTLGGSAYESMSKASRQVANFASNRLSAAAVSAFQQACDKMNESAA